LQWIARLLFALCFVCAAEAQPRHIYLTYSDDPATSIDINFHTDGEHDAGQVRWDSESKDGRRYRYANRADAVSTSFEGLRVERTVHTVRLTGLEPNTTYYFVAGNRQAGYSEERSFRTCPNDGSPIRFITGGDMGITRAAIELMQQAAQFDPAFGLIGGDIAYANGEFYAYRTWDAWFRNWEENMVAPDGRMIPVVAAIGNHETNDIESPDPTKVAPFFFAYFGQQAGRTYFDLQFGPNLAIIALDSGHVIPHADQTGWLSDTLAKYEHVPHRFAVYHVPLYPSHRPYDGDYSVRGRELWGPIFDQYNLTGAFENHDHTLKRTHPIKGNAIAEDGIVYLGDGSMGRDPRPVGEERRWYEALAKSVYHFWVVDVSADGVSYQAIDENGDTQDTFDID
jgi:acid phosphatase type 7